MKRFLKLSAMAAGLALFGALPSQAAVMIGFNATADADKVDIVVSGLAGEIVAAYDLDVTFDSGLSIQDVVFGSELGGPLNSFQWPWAVTAPGVLDIAEVSFLSDADLDLLQDGNSVKLATIDFSGDVDVADLGFLWGPGQDIKGAKNRVIYPNVVPEPGTMVLLGSGLLGLAAARRRGKR